MRGFRLRCTILVDDVEPESVAIALEFAANDFRNDPLEAGRQRHISLSHDSGFEATVVMIADEVPE